MYIYFLHLPTFIELLMWSRRDPLRTACHPLRGFCRVPSALIAIDR